MVVGDVGVVVVVVVVVGVAVMMVIVVMVALRVKFGIYDFQNNRGCTYLRNPFH